MSRLSSCFREYIRYKKVSAIRWMLDDWWAAYREIEYFDKDENPQCHAHWEKETNRSVRKAWKMINGIMKANYKQLDKYRKEIGL